MITIITGILDFFLMTWVFWPLVCILPLAAYYNVKSALDSDESEVFSGILITGLIAALAYHYPILRGYFDGWRAILVIVGGYIACGFLLSIYKWLSVLFSFKRSNPVERIKAIREERKGNVYQVTLEGIVKSEFQKCNITDHGDGTFTIFPNWKDYPIGLWWVYWPFFLLEIPFDFIRNVSDAIFKWLKDLYNQIAKSFSVRVG